MDASQKKSRTRSSRRGHAGGGGAGSRLGSREGKNNRVPACGGHLLPRSDDQFSQRVTLCAGSACLNASSA